MNGKVKVKVKLAVKEMNKVDISVTLIENSFHN